MKVKKSLRTSLLRIIIIPLVLLLVCIIIYNSYYLTTLIYDQVKDEMKGVAQTVIYMYDTSFPGEYQMEDGVITMKGGRSITEAFEKIEGYKQAFGADVTIFYGDQRLVTTIRNKEGNPITGTKADATVIEDVLKGKEEHFYTHTDINGNHYVSYYCPLYDQSGQCTGMVFAGKQVQHVRSIVLGGLIPMIVAILLSVGAVILIMSLYAGRLSKCMQKLGDFFLRVESGDLKAGLGTDVLGRKDELGRIGKSAVEMQTSLRDLIERDSLTGLYNRHHGELMLREAQRTLIEKEIPFFVSIGDIDFFKKFNDNYGHDCGDLVLKEISHVLKEAVKENGSVARWGGEEFLFVVSGKQVNDIEGFINQVAGKVKELSINYNDEVLGVTMTFGVADGCEKGSTDEAVKRADQALYEGKQTGRDKVVYKH